MSKIIPLDDRLKLTAEKRAAVLRKQKIMAVRKLFQCTHCAAKCERCGISLSADPSSGQSPHPRTPYHFCNSCADEYIDYINRLQGKGNPEAYWHNDHWMKVWQTWIEYQGATDQYLRSKEFRRLLDELGPGDLQCD